LREKKISTPIKASISGSENWMDFSAQRQIFLKKVFFEILLFWAEQYSSLPSFSYLNN
jgi:hypothetical protein